MILDRSSSFLSPISFIRISFYIAVKYEITTALTPARFKLNSRRA
jgi:hypothetical protein